MHPLGVLLGAVVGFSLGLTGGGGAIFAVPLLVYGLSVAPHEAVGISLAAVGATAFIGFLQRLRKREVEVGTGLVFAVAGMVGAPVGSMLSGYVPANVLLVLFSALMLIVAGNMWKNALQSGGDSTPGATGACERDSAGHLSMTSRCAVLLIGVGLLTGLLAGLFGVGGGFVIVPALMFFTSMGIHRAISTSLFVIALVSAAGVGSIIFGGKPLSLDITALFIAGGVVGLGLGTWLSRWLSGPRLQKSFAAAIVGVAAFIVIETLI